MKDLKSGIERLKQAKAHMSKANGVMSNCISKLKFLEEENAELRAKLADWEGNAEGFEPDAYMKLPLDADGVPIRVGDEMDIDGEIAVVRGYQVSYKGDELQFIAVTEGYRKTFTLFGKNRKHFKHDTMPSDSWEKLEEYANLSSRDYCKEHRLEECDYNMRVHLLARAKKLAGIEEAE